jgi:hypothetical protein
VIEEITQHVDHNTNPQVTLSPADKPSLSSTQALPICEVTAI